MPFPRNRPWALLEGTRAIAPELALCMGLYSSVVSAGEEPSPKSPTDEALRREMPSTVPSVGVGAVAPSSSADSSVQPTPESGGEISPPVKGEGALGSPSVPPVALHTIAALLADAATDLGLSTEGPPNVTLASDCREEFVPRVPAEGAIGLAGVVEFREQKWQLKVIVVRADATVHSVTTLIEDSGFEVQTIRALALLTKQSTSAAKPAPTRQASSASSPAEVSQGRATLATTGALLGGYFGFALENAGGDVDTRLVYPLVALGAGVGLASALIVAEEWPLNRPSAWYISGAGSWLTVSGVLIASEQNLTHATDRYPYGLIGTATGLGIASYVVSQRDISEEEAVFSHSGAIFGTIAGGFIQELIRPDSGASPKLGIGIGAGVGWLGASLGTARLMPGLTSSRVLFADLGGFLGALVGAAAASPAVVTQGPPRPDDRRAFVGASLAGLVVGSVAGYWLGGNVDEDSAASSVEFGLGVSTTAQTTPATPYDVAAPSATTFHLDGTW